MEPFSQWALREIISSYWWPAEIFAVLFNSGYAGICVCVCMRDWKSEDVSNNTHWCFGLTLLASESLLIFLKLRHRLICNRKLWQSLGCWAGWEVVRAWLALIEKLRWVATLSPKLSLLRVAQGRLGLLGLLIYGGTVLFGSFGWFYQCWIPTVHISSCFCSSPLFLDN